MNEEEKQRLMLDILCALVDYKFLTLLRLAAKCFPGMDAADLYNELKKQDERGASAQQVC